MQRFDLNVVFPLKVTENRLDPGPEILIGTKARQIFVWWYDLLLKYWRRQLMRSGDTVHVLHILMCVYLITPQQVVFQ